MAVNGHSNIKINRSHFGKAWTGMHEGIRKIRTQKRLLKSENRNLCIRIGNAKMQLNRSLLIGHFNLIRTNVSMTQISSDMCSITYCSMSE